MSIFEKLSVKLGKIGYVVFILLFSAIPFAFLRLPIWLEFIIFLAAQIFSFVIPAVWAAGLIAAIIGQQSIFSLIYYVLFAAFFAIPFIKTLITGK